MEKFKKLIKITVLMVCTVLILACFGFYYISIKSDQDEVREEIERISEKQQILSQQILKNVLLIANEKNLKATATRSALRTQVQVFKKQHQFVTKHVTDASLGSKLEMEQLNNLIHTASPAYQTILRTANTALNTGFVAPTKDYFINEINKSETDFLDKMNLVTQIARLNQEQVDNQVYKLNMFILGALVISLLSLGFLVITPIFKQSVNDYKTLLMAKNEAEVANKALSENEEKYRNLFASNPLPMWLFDPQSFKILDVNGIACTHYGYTREEFLSMTTLDLRTDKNKEVFIAAAHPLKLPAQDYDRGIWQHRKKDGSEIEVEIFAHDALFEGRNARMVVINDITKRRRAEEKLKHNEANLEQAQKMAHFGHWELSFATGKSIWSAEACRIYGLDEEDNEHTYENWLSFIHPEDLESVIHHTKLAEQTASRTEFYHRIVLKDGSIKHLFSQSHFEFDQNGNPIGLYGVAHDVTEEKLAEEQLINANRLYSVISGINQLIVHTENEHTLFLKACQIATELGKFDLAWIGKIDVNQGMLNLIAHSNASPQDLEYITAIAYDKDGPVQKVLQTGSYYYRNNIQPTTSNSKVDNFGRSRNFKSFICLPIKKLGVVYATLNLFSNKTDLFNPQEILLLEEVAGDISFALDVFEKKFQAEQAESSLAQSEANLRMIMDLLPQRIFVKDPFGKFLFVNKSFAELYGMSPKEVIQASRAGKLTTFASNETFIKDDQQVISEGKQKIIPEELFLAPSGEEKIFHVTKLPYFWGRAKQQSVLGILNEITEQKRAESERNVLLADIVRRNVSLEQFAYIISHNLRAPVANILALSALLQTVNNKHSETGSLLKNLAISTQKLDEVIKDLNKILQTTHHTKEKKEKVNFAELCADVRLSMGNQFEREEIALMTDFSAVQSIYGVKSYLYSIFYNLIANSIKYRQPNVPVQIKISSGINQGKIELVFTDNGMGMDLEQIGDELFGLYKRFHTHVEGKGMGLYMIKQHVALMGGEIELNSKLNEGTTFKICLPEQR